MDPYHSSNAIRRYAGNPILTKNQVPYPSELVYNAGVIKFQGRYVMAFRNDYGVTEKDFEDYSAGRRPDWPPLRTNIGLAFSHDGLTWEVQPKPCFALDDLSGEVTHAYDPRLTLIEGRVYMCFATNTRHGLRAGIAVTDDFESFEILHLTVPDNRNMVLFPEKIGGRFMRLERPFPVYGRGGMDRFDIWLSASPDMRYWGDTSLVLAVEDVPFSNDKIGPAAPPIRTERGWLTIFHAVDRDDVNRGKNGWEATWTKRYTAGIMLLDLNDPTQVVGMSKLPLMVPEAPYEIRDGLRNNVVFPGGLILEETGEVKIYYGAADTVQCLAFADVEDLIAICSERR